ncbi:hypothetical protein CSOJ01_02270 [Colletotrichum sojae]|uniref:Uncharacterized protein n=1 Tax=Colletotrichum sojae TaxID=2175907 RepID=A0A8H6N359_9PEZI|nr:hypothetical protein CSOJ01_02270 [Colletotrichum sojae]
MVCEVRCFTLQLAWEPGSMVQSRLFRAGDWMSQPVFFFSGLAGSGSQAEERRTTTHPPPRHVIWVAYAAMRHGLPFATPIWAKFGPSGGVNAARIRRDTWAEAMHDCMHGTPAHVSRMLWLARAVDRCLGHRITA